MAEIIAPPAERPEQSCVIYLGVAIGPQQRIQLG
jgi:hypothetical protein